MKIIITEAQHNKLQMKQWLLRRQELFMGEYGEALRQISPCNHDDVESYIEGIMEEYESHEIHPALLLQNEVEESEFQTPPRRTTTDDVADLLETPEPPAVPVIELNGDLTDSPLRKRLRSEQSCPLFPLPLQVYKDIENVEANAE